MKFLLAGASGAIGVPLTRHLIAAGHRVVGLSRTPINHDALRALGAKTMVVDAIDREALLRTVDGLQADAVIHQLTALKNASPRVRADDPTSALRVRGTSNLLDVASLVGARRFLVQSLIFGYGYGDHGTRELTEHDPFGHAQGGYADSVIAALESAERQAFAAATVAALKRGRPGQPYNVVDDEPVNWRTFTWALAGAFDTPKPWELPHPVLRLVAPYLAVMMTSTLRVSNARVRRELESTPSMPSYCDGVRSMTTAPHESA